MRARIRRRARAVVEALEPRQLLSTYYVSPGGSDASSGVSIAAPWRTIERVNRQTLRPGDTILFEGGKTHYGSLYIPSREGGTAEKPITFSNYGTGRATIRSGDKAGIDIAQSAGISISNINFVGSGTASNTWPGIWIHVDWADRKLSTIKVKNVDVRGYGSDGLKMLIAGANSSISDVRIEYSSFHDNLLGGVKITGSAPYASRNYVIDHVKAYNNHGSRALASVTGSGIYLADVDGGRISRCVAWNNGKDGVKPVGIWVAGSNRVTIEYCESYNNRTAAATDGGGFDFDWDVTNSLMQYNYSHGNDGPGYLLCAGTYNNQNNTVRYNVSENDGRKNGAGGIHLWGNVRDAKIYNNVIYMTHTGNGNTSAFRAHDIGAQGRRPYNVQVRNNIFYTAGGAKIINISSGVANRAGALDFVGNTYHSAGSFKLQWGSTRYGSVRAWRSARGQEMLGGLGTGYQGDPQLAAAGMGGTIGNADNLKNLGAYRLRSSSPLINRGVAQPTFLSGASRDFYGDTLPRGGRYDIGIDEVA